MSDSRQLHMQSTSDNLLSNVIMMGINTVIFDLKQDNITTMGSKHIWDYQPASAAGVALRLLLEGGTLHV